MYHLARLKFPDKQILTIEDPVEIKQEDMLQLQLNEAIGATYDNLIKLSLRHRPDLLIIGEIRDAETARAVIRASLTGATVFSTVHARSISGVYARMLELGVGPEELNNALQGIAYQRLIGGGGVVDFAKEITKTIPQTSGMRKLIGFLQQDISVFGRQKQKKLPLARQRKVIELFNNLLPVVFIWGDC